MSILEITSRDNPGVKRYGKLAASRREREKQRLFVTEGDKLTGEAFCAGCTLKELYLTRQAREQGSDRLRALLDVCERAYLISDQVAQKMAQSVTPQGVFGVFAMLDNEGQTVKISSNGKYLLLSSLQDPGNIGTILRTAGAFGIDGVVLSHDCPDLYSPKLLRATMGGIFKAPIAVVDNLEKTINLFRQNGVVVYAAALRKNAVPLQSLSLQKGGCAVVIGNEGSGLSEDICGACDGSVIIPMQTHTESLNAAMAAGIFLWEMTK